MTVQEFPRLQTESFTATIADNSARGVHRAGYNGVASLVPVQTGKNLFVPDYAGLNYETIGLAGLPPYREQHQSPFEPRCEPMHIESAGAGEVVLVQPETSHAHVSARITFTVEEPCYLHQRIALTFHRSFCRPGERRTFGSLWASYLHAPTDRHIYLKTDRDSGPLCDWVGVTKTAHDASTAHVRRLPGDREIDAAQHIEAMRSQPPLPDQDSLSAATRPASLPDTLSGPLYFYYGLCDDSLLYLMMFRQPERFRLAYSPCGGGTEPAWNPAWDYVLSLDDARIGHPCVWDLCLAVQPFRGRTAILDEVKRYRTNNRRTTAV